VTADSVKKIRYWLEWFFVSRFAWLVPMIPLAVLRILADFAGTVFYLVERRSRAEALANLEAAFWR
jgi:lauroyl/myristoyl acyltransferase